MTVVEMIIVLELFATALGAITFLAVYGPPWRYLDRGMSWHLASLTAVAGLEAIALLFVRAIGLVPLALIYGGSAAVVYWRLVLLLRARRDDRSAVDKRR